MGSFCGIFSGLLCIGEATLLNLAPSPVWVMWLFLNAISKRSVKALGANRRTLMTFMIAAYIFYSVVFAIFVIAERNNTRERWTLTRCLLLTASFVWPLMAVAIPFTVYLRRRPFPRRLTILMDYSGNSAVPLI